MNNDDLDLAMDGLGDLRPDDLNLDSGDGLGLSGFALPTQRKHPLDDVVFVNNFEKDAKAELNQAQKAFHQRAEDERKRFELATDTEYWFCVCFQTREQKDEFLRKSGLTAQGDKYLDGLKVAKKFGVKMDSATVELPRGRVDDSWHRDFGR